MNLFSRFRLCVWSRGARTNMAEISSTISIAERMYRLLDLVDAWFESEYLIRVSVGDAHGYIQIFSSWALSSAYSLLILSQLGRIKLLDRCEIGQWETK